MSGLPLLWITYGTEPASSARDAALDWAINAYVYEAQPGLEVGQAAEGLLKVADQHPFDLQTVHRPRIGKRVVSVEVSRYLIMAAAQSPCGHVDPVVRVSRAPAERHYWIIRGRLF